MIYYIYVKVAYNVHYKDLRYELGTLNVEVSWLPRIWWPTNTEGLNLTTDWGMYLALVQFTKSRESTGRGVNWAEGGAGRWRVLWALWCDLCCVQLIIYSSSFSYTSFIIFNWQWHTSEPTELFIFMINNPNFRKATRT